MSLPQPDRTLDAQGLLCPLPVIRARQAIDGLAPGQVLEVLATDPGSVPDFQAWCASLGHELLLSEEPEPGLFRFLIRKR
jgi:tRNA 2-thiouridine synthesizing protein A